MSKEQAAKALKELTDRYGVAKVAKHFGVHRQAIYQILWGKRKPGPRILKALGFREIKQVIRLDELTRIE